MMKMQLLSDRHRMALHRSEIITTMRYIPHLTTSDRTARKPPIPHKDAHN
jgi:hypothetical protein